MIVNVGEMPRHLFKPNKPGSDICVCGLYRVVHATWRPDTEHPAT